MNRMMNLAVLSLAGLTGQFVWLAPATAQSSFPNRPVRFITPYAPGGSTTVMAHYFSQKLTEIWGHNVIVDNRPGGNTIIGTQTLARSTPDGYTIMLTNNSIVINPSLFTHLPYDPLKDFTPIGTVYAAEFVLVTGMGVPAANVQELIALAKEKPGQINYGTTGAGGSAHLASELLNVTAGIKTQHIPYKGAGAVVTDLVAGQIQFYFSNALAVLPMIQAGKLRPIAITGEARLPILPNVPTFTESGMKGMDVKPWFCVLGPAGIPKPIANKLSSDFQHLVTRADVGEYMAKQGLSPFPGTPEQLMALLQSDLVKWAKLIKVAGIKLQE
jgi:tripartite-type tricarboxylate transporter receptor subunit TctC